MDTKKYEVLEKTVELSSLTKAAQELGLTQSGVSHMLAAIEAELQLPLLKRTRTGARLTPEGEQMMPYIHEIVRQEKLLRQAAAALHTLVTGKIRIGTFTSVATHWLPAMMMQFQQAYPQVDFQLFNGDYHDIDTWLGAGSVDLAFTTLPARPGCSCVPLYEDALAAVLPKGHPLAAGPVCPVEELAKEPFISLLESSNHDVRRAFRALSVKPNIRFETKDDYAVIAMAAAARQHGRRGDPPDRSASQPHDRAGRRLRCTRPGRQPVRGVRCQMGQGKHIKNAPGGFEPSGRVFCWGVSEN